MIKEKSRPKKAENLKIINHIGTLYITFDGSDIWRIDRVACGILRMCDGKKTVKEIVREVAKKAGLEPKDVKKIVMEILEELKKKKFIEFKEKA